MRIKNLIIAAGLISLASCDKINSPYRQEIIVQDFCATGIDDSIPNKKVLVEDYTGHTCGYCPDAGIYLNDTLKEIYQHCIVVVSVHAGFFAGTCPTAISCPHPSPPLPSDAFTTDFNTSVGSAWNTFFAITGNPKGMIDRIDYPNSTHSKTYPAWAPAIASQLELPAKAKLKISNTYNSTNRNLSVSVESEFTESISGEYKLQVVITEDSLYDWQQWYFHTPQYVPDYLHRHVLRDGLNTTWGETLVTGNTSSGTTITKNYNYVINNDWIDSHCNVVAFIYDAATYEVLQAEEAAVIE